MPIYSLTTAEYEAFLKNAPELPLWQSVSWKAYQEQIGRRTRLYGLKNASGELSAAALCIVDRTRPIGVGQAAFALCTWDIPRGPIGVSEEAKIELLEGIVEEARRDRCMALYYSPQEAISNQQSAISSRHEQPEATIVLDLTLSDEEHMKQMKEKGRYNIRLAEKRGVVVQESENIDAFYELLQRTGGRDQFGIKPKSHYEKFLQILPGAFLLLAYSPSPNPSPSPIAGLLGTTHNSTGIYYYGASNYEHRALMAPYLLQWEAMKLCRGRGCARYDLFGIAPESARHSEQGEGDSERRDEGQRTHPWAGVTRFKKQFGGEVLSYPPEQEIVLKPMMKMLIGWKRKIVG